MGYTNILYVYFCIYLLVNFRRFVDFLRLDFVDRFVLRNLLPPYPKSLPKPVVLGNSSRFTSLCNSKNLVMKCCLNSVVPIQSRLFVKIVLNYSLDIFVKAAFITSITTLFNWLIFILFSCGHWIAFSITSTGVFPSFNISQNIIYIIHILSVRRISHHFSRYHYFQNQRYNRKHISKQYAHCNSKS